MQRFGTSIGKLAAHLKRGGLIAYPTESCYGLGCDPRNRNAVMRLLKLKQRPQRKGLILIAGKFTQLAAYLQTLTQEQQAILRRDGAQAITYLMPVKHSVPRWLRGAHDTLAVRITAHRQASLHAIRCVRRIDGVTPRLLNRHGAPHGPRRP